MRRIATIAALAVPGLLAAGVAAPVAVAADDCPNAAVRAQQGVQHLPNCLAYEKVTPDEKGGALPSVDFAISADGGNLLFSMNAAVEDSTSFAGPSRYVASRTPDGAWSSRTTFPALDGAVMPKLADSTKTLAASPDLSRTVLWTQFPIDPNDQGIVNPRTFAWTADAYLRDSDGSVTWLVPDPSVVDTSTVDVTAVGASRDLDRVVLQTRRMWDPRVTATNVDHLYVWNRDGDTVLASVLPNGDPAPAVGVSVTSSSGAVVTRQNAVSADGRRVAFVSGPDEDRRTYVRFNADDPSRAVTREASVGPNGERCVSDTGTLTFRALSADGTKLLFRCLASAQADTLPGGLYLRQLGRGPQAVQPLVLGGRADFIAGNADFSRIYVQNAGTILLVRDTAVEPTPLVATTPNATLASTAVSPDGEQFAVETSAEFDLPGVDPASGGSVDYADTEVYVYSARTGQAACASCRQDGTPTEGRGGLRALGAELGAMAIGAPVTPVTDVGSVAFTTTTGLAPEDTNGVSDAYAWIDGRAVLLSSGRGGGPSVANGASADGSLFLVTPSSLVANDTDGGANDIYVARPNGGRLLPDAPAVCATQCQSAGPGTPEAPRIGTGEALPDGNLVEQTTRPRATVGLTASTSVRGTSTTVRVKASRAGTIRLSGNGLRRVTKTVKQAGTYRVTVRLTASAAKRQRSRGRLATRVTARFAPSSGAPVQTSKAVTFVAKKGGR